MLKITVDVFSGRLNPSWLLDEDESKKLIKTLVRNRGAIAKIESGFDGLGFRGIIIESVSDDFLNRYDLSNVFKIANGGSQNDSKGFEIAEQLISTMPNQKSMDSINVFDKKFADLLLMKLNTFHDFKPITILDPSAPRESDPESNYCAMEIAKFDPDFWNDGGHVQESNNCYNYASNIKTNTFAQPGRGSGIKITQANCTCVELVKATLADGCHTQFDCFGDSESPRWLMALVVDPNHDFHWYRLHDEPPPAGSPFWRFIGGPALPGGSFWGHKPGGRTARITDDSNRVITNPEECDRRGYTDFCGYFMSCKTQQLTIR